MPLHAPELTIANHNLDHNIRDFYDDSLDIFGITPSLNVANHWFNAILEALNGPERHYHNARTVSDQLMECDFIMYVKNEVSNYDAAMTYLSILFYTFGLDHTVNNWAAKSSELWKEFGRDVGLSQNTIDKTASLIACAQTPPVTDVEGIIYDVIRAIYSEPLDVYTSYCSRLRQEFYMLSDTQWAQRRQRELYAILNQPHIYAPLDGIFGDTSEARARANLTAELNTIDSYLEFAR